uniref:SFRICE_032485 n=1 Tax=Spodoptera frugiperda TaxID=7108 RepID=A0A2H1V1C8_SPOFR
MAELPVFKKCCFCIPLRYGLLTWGYLKLGISTAILIIFLIILSQIPLSHSKDLNIVIMIIVVILTEVVVHCGFIVGVHKKAVKIMRLYFYYALFMWSVTMMAAVVVTGLLSVSLYFTDSSLEIIIFTTTIVAFALSIAVQTFLLLALRSEIIKLRSNCPYRFVKDDNEPEGTITPVNQNIDLTSTNSTEPIQEKMAF